MLPGLTGDWQGGLYTPSDGRGEPQKAAPAIAAAARGIGAVVLQQCAVRGIETQGGRVAAVVTEKGRIACDSVVLAGGVWSRLFCGNLDLRLPQLKVMSSVMRTEPFERGLETSCSGFGFGVRKRLDGGYNVASWSGNVVDIVPDTFRFFADFLPALRHAMAQHAAAHRREVPARNGRCRDTGRSMRPRRSSACARWIPSRISRSWIRRGSTSPRRSRRSAT